MLRRAIAHFSVWQLFRAFAILALQICDLRGDFQGKKFKISLSLTWGADKFCNSLVETQKRSEIELAFFHEI